MGSNTPVLSDTLQRPPVFLLPPELLSEIIIHLLGTQAFINFISTCSTVNEVFVDNREAILAQYVYQTIHIECGVAVEADACITAKCRFPRKNSPHQLPDLLRVLDKYQTLRSQQLSPERSFQNANQILFCALPHDSEPRLEIRRIDPKPILQWPPHHFNRLTRLYKQHTTIRKCVECFCERTCEISNDERLTHHQQERRKSPLSHTEKRRLYRAFYRFALYHELFHYNMWSTKPGVLYTMWLSMFPPHECEEMATVYSFLGDEWTTIFQVQYGLTSWRSSMAIPMFIAEGLKAFLKYRSEEYDGELDLASKECYSSSERLDVKIMGDCLRETTPFQHRLSGGIVRGGFPEQGTELVFENDHPDCPNYGWLWSFSHKMSDEFYHEDHSELRKIGHVIWDKDRLDSWNIYKGAPPIFYPPHNPFA